MKNFFRLYGHVICVIACLLVSAIFLIQGALRDAAIMDELAHIPSGYSYVRYLDYRLNPEHPPLVKVLAGIPLLFASPSLSFPTTTDAWTSGVNSQWDLGNKFIYWSNGDRANEIIFLSRIGPILLTLFLIWFVYFWAKKLVGKWWAFLPMIGVALSPHILAHGHYVTTDIGAAVGFLVGLYFFMSYLQSQTPRALVYAGLAFGVAQLLKFSLVLLAPLYVLLVILYWWGEIHRNHNGVFSREAWILVGKYVLKVLAIFCIGAALIAVVYAVLTLQYPIEKQVFDTRSILSGPLDQYHQFGCLARPLGCLSAIDEWMASVPLVRGFGHYMLGVLMVFQRAAGGNDVYFLGTVGNLGWWYYFPAVFLMKETIPVLILIFFGILFALTRYYRAVKNRKLIPLDFSGKVIRNFSSLALLMVVLFYWIYSMRSTLNIGFRHILPTIPLIYILIAISIKKWFIGLSIRYIGILKKSGYAILCIFGLWIFAEALYTFPHHLSYFNEFSGGIWNGYQYVTDSNYDWGQDAKVLAEYVASHNIQSIAVDYFGGADMYYYLGSSMTGWNADRGNPLNLGIPWIAISVNQLQMARYGNHINSAGDAYYRWLTRPDAPYERIGTSIFLYRLQ